MERSAFDSRVQFQPADMRTLEGLTGKYDFVWSSCALEHLGTLQAGIDFVVKSASMLKPGGVAVHTTEFNVGSNTGTIELGDSMPRTQCMHVGRRAFPSESSNLPSFRILIGDIRLPRGQECQKS